MKKSPKQLERDKRGINGFMSKEEIIYVMSEGNPGALTVMENIMKTSFIPEQGLGIILSMAEMNIRGYQIWLVYKDYAGEDIVKFKKAIHYQEQEMIDFLNENPECKADGLITVKKG